MRCDIFLCIHIPPPRRSSFSPLLHLQMKDRQQFRTLGQASTMAVVYKYRWWAGLENTQLQAIHVPRTRAHRTKIITPQKTQTTPLATVVEGLLDQALDLITDQRLQRNTASLQALNKQKPSSFVLLTHSSVPETFVVLRPCTTKRASVVGSIIERGGTRGETTVGSN